MGLWRLIGLSAGCVVDLKVPSVVFVFEEDLDDLVVVVVVEV